MTELGEEARRSDVVLGAAPALLDDGAAYLARYESSARTYARTFNRVMETGSLATVRDVNGATYLDFLTCAGALPLGHNHPYVMERVRAMLASGQIQQALDIPTVAKVHFVEELLRTLPASFGENVRLQFCGPTGSDAVEAAIKLFRTVTGRSTVVTFHGAYHGMTQGSLAATGDLHPKQHIGPTGGTTYFLPFPDELRCPFGIGGAASASTSLAYLASVFSDPMSGITKPAMVIVESVQGEGGCNVAPPEWLRGLRALTSTHDIPLVLDEVQTGFGRTGRMFGYEAADIVPDAVVMSKAIGGGYPLAVLAYHDRYDTWEPGAHAGTFRGNQLAMVAGAATMAFIRDERLDVAAQEKGEHLLARLRELTHLPCVGDVRGRGLMVGVEIVCPTCATGPGGVLPLDGILAQRVKEEAFARGLLVETGGRHSAVVRLLPPLVISISDLDAAVEILADAIAAALAANTRVPAVDLMAGMADAPQVSPILPCTCR